MSSMPPRYLSLTLLNWNGFFARTFDLDPKITTLSGGNGTGKSTVLSAFLAALVPDLSLLQFRNATDGPSSGASRDRGLHGKLNLGECYALLRAQNAQGEETLFGVHLQRQPSREGKVQLRPLIIATWQPGRDPITFFTQAVEGSENIRILPPSELQKEARSSKIECRFSQSISEYHHHLFLMGLLPKSFRSLQERGQLYKLLQASLHGGVPSSITQSLKSYLLPEQLGLKSAFKELETALYENRITLLALKETQSLHETFSALVDAASRYLGSEYARWDQLLRMQRQDALRYRRALTTIKEASGAARLKQTQLQQQQTRLEQELKTQEKTLQELSNQHHLLGQLQRCAADLDAHQSLQAATQVELNDLTAQKEIAEKKYRGLQAQLHQAETELANLQKELADQEVALNASQLRALQYRQAEAVWKTALPLLPPLPKNEKAHSKETVQEKLLSLQKDLAKQQEKGWDIEQHIRRQKRWVTQSGELNTKISAALQAFDQISSPNQKENSLKKSDDLTLEKIQALKSALQRAQGARSETERLKRAIFEHGVEHKRILKNAKIWQELEVEWCNLNLATPKSAQELSGREQDLISELKKNEQGLQNFSTQRALLDYKQSSLTEKKPQLQAQQLRWVKALQYQRVLEQQIGQPLTTREAFEKQWRLIKERQENLLESERIRQQEISGLQGLLDSFCQPYPHHLQDRVRRELNEIAGAVEGIPLIEFLSHAPLEQAQELSALLEPFQVSLVVENVALAQAILQTLPDFSFETTFYLFSKSELSNAGDRLRMSRCEKGIWVSESLFQGQRYTPFPEIPWVGEEARREKEQTVRAQIETARQLSVQEQKLLLQNRQLLDIFESFFSQHASPLFDHPEAEHALQKFNVESQDLARQRIQLEQECNQIERVVMKQRCCLKQISDLALSMQDIWPPYKAVEISSQLERDLHQQFVAYRAQKEWYEQYEGLQQEIPKAEVLLSDHRFIVEHPEKKLEEHQQHQKTLAKQEFILQDLLNRWEHLSFKADADHLQKPETLKTQIQTRLLAQEALCLSFKEEYGTAHRTLEGLNQKHVEVRLVAEKQQGMHQILSENSTLIKKQIPTELLGCVDTEIYSNFCKKLEETKENVHRLQVDRVEITKIWAQTLADSAQMSEKEQDAQQVYRSARKQLLYTKEQFLHLKAQLQRLPLHEELFTSANKSSEQLRQEADRAVGDLQDLTQSYPHLRERLKQSQDSGKIEQKLSFFSAILEFLRQRIRKDLLQTHDPFQALSTMKMELVRLKKELQDREKRLKLSTQGIAHLIQRSIQREKYRIEQLNRTLNGIGFGQISAIRLNLRLLNSHQEFLTQLSQTDQLSLFSEADQSSQSSSGQSFLERLGALYCQMVPVSYQGPVQLAELGEKLLDYRSYLSLSVEIQRQSTEWISADMGALSTGEAIGVGLTLLLMIVQSWEEEMVRLRGHSAQSCRILPLDEAARLDSTSIETLFELCEKLRLQLFLAAPESLQTQQGTAYQLRRIYIDHHPHVHVIGLKRLIEPSKNK